MFKKSVNMREEYCAQIVKIGKVEPVENSDRLAKTIINGFQVVVGKDDVKEGDIMVYCKLETAINSEFLSVNNQFEIGERHLNKNHEEVEALLTAGKDDEAKAMVGYFNKHGRVRIVKLRGCPSEGCLFTIDSLIKWNKKIADYDFEQCLIPNADGVIEPFNFDTIDDELFVKVYVPATNMASQGRGDKMGKKTRKLTKRFDRMVEGQFAFLYDTNQLADNMWRFKPDTPVTISVKIHGTSAIFANLLVRKPKCETIAWKIKYNKLNRELKYLYNKNINYTYWQKKIKKKRAEAIKNILNSHYTLDYGKITSSRNTIKNQYINHGKISHFYEVDSTSGKDVWTTYGDILYPYIDKGLSVYGEIFGYQPNGKGYQSLNGKVCDYGCEPNKSKFMPYRITFTDNNGDKVEWEVTEVLGWTLKLVKDHPELSDIIMPIPILYNGTLGELYPDVDKDIHWNENVLKRLRSDKEHFGMECNEPLSKNKMPREGIVVRINNDVKSEAFKLKCYAFLGKEAEDVDKGLVDIEMEQSY